VSRSVMRSRTTSRRGPFAARRSLAAGTATTAAVGEPHLGQRLMCECK
jgi:hypothetical protein